MIPLNLTRPSTKNGNESNGTVGMWKAHLKSETINSYQGRRNSSSKPSSSTPSISTPTPTLPPSSSQIRATGFATPTEYEAKILAEYEQQDSKKITKESLPNRNRIAYHCDRCQEMTAYVSNHYSKRGGTKIVYRCEKCLKRWSDFFCDEEDYDFLSG